MKSESIRGNQAMDLELANVQWSTTQWQLWCAKNNVGVILEDGRVTGWEERPKTWHK